VADALALSTLAYLEDGGITRAAAVSIAASFGSLGDEENLEPKPLVEPELHEPEPPSGPMAGFDEEAVLAWLGTVPGLTAAQRAAAAHIMAEDEYEGAELAVVKPKTLLWLLKGSDAEKAVPALLAARDTHLAAATSAVAAAVMAPAAAAATAAAEVGERVAAEVESLSPPEEFVCAISQQLVVDPVTADEGAAAMIDCHRLRASQFAIQWRTIETRLMT
jgi:hypothetical protein